MESVGSSIISSLGAGSGINSGSIVSQLTEVEKAPRQQQIDTKKETLESKISDFGIVRSALSTLQEQAELLSKSETFNSKSASFSDSQAFIPVSLNEDAPVGSYSFEVLDVAQSQSLSSGLPALSDPTNSIGKGTMTIDFGAWDPDAPPLDFTPNSDKDALVITIDDDNNSLNGLKDAINNADAGVNASIINDGSGYRLLITAESGFSNQLSISVAEDPMAPGLSGFEYNETTQNLTEAQVGKDASLKVNGLLVSRSSNNIDDVLEGFEFNLAKADPGNIVNVTITEDKAAGEQAVRDFVATFNEFLIAIEPAVGVNSETDEKGSLERDPTARSLQTQLRNLIASAVPGVDSGFSSLTNVGIRTELDGTLSIHEDDFQAAFDDNYELVKGLFSSQASSSSDKIEVNSFRESAVPGTYDVNITQDPEKGQLLGAAASGTLLTDLAQASTIGNYTGVASAFAGTDLATQGAVLGDYGFDIVVDGGSLVNIQLPIADYADEAAIATALQTQFDDNDVQADIVHNGSEFVVTSRTQGANSGVIIGNIDENTPGEFGLEFGTGVAGTGPAADEYDFTITVNGTESGNINLSLGTYATQDELADHIQAQINNDSTLKANGGEVDVVWNTDHFEITSRRYGDKSNVSVVAVGASAADLGLSTGTSSAGKDVAGTFDGVVGFGVGNVLLPKLDTDPYGISLLVQPGAASSNVNFSRGFGSELSQLIDSYLESNGILDTRETTLNSDIKDLEGDQEALDRRMTAYHARLLSQFLAMERIVNGFTSAGGALGDIGNRLPFTASSR